MVRVNVVKMEFFVGEVVFVPVRQWSQAGTAKSCSARRVNVEVMDFSRCFSLRRVDEQRVAMVEVCKCTQNRRGAVALARVRAPWSSRTPLDGGKQMFQKDDGNVSKGLSLGRG